MSNVLEKLRTFKVLFLDADGVFFDGAESRLVFPNNEVAILKTRDHRDGQGISFLRDCGIQVVFVSGEGEPLGSIIQKINSLPSVQSGAWKPVEAALGKNAKGSKTEYIEVWLHQKGIDWGDCVYIGDDINDLHSMHTISENGGISVAPANATRKINEIADVRLNFSGGHGAIREFTEMVLDARGIDESGLSPA